MPDEVASEAPQHSLETLPVETWSICSATATARPIEYGMVPLSGRFPRDGRS